MTSNNRVFASLVVGYAVVLCMMPFVALGSSAASLSEDETQDAIRTAFLMEKLHFYYVPDPLKSDYHRLINNEIHAGKEEGMFWTNQGMGALQQLVRTLLRLPKNAADRRFQHYTMMVLWMTEKPVTIWLVDDSKGGYSEARVDPNWKALWYMEGRVYPRATNTELHNMSQNALYSCMGRTDYEPVSDQMAGWIATGITYYQELDVLTGKTAFLRDLMYTQNRVFSRSNLLFYSGGDAFGPGLAPLPYAKQLVPEVALAYQIGVPISIRLIFDPTQLENGFNYLARERALWVERTSTGDASLYIPDAWTLAQKQAYLKCMGAAVTSLNDQLYRQLRTAGVEETGLKKEETEPFAEFSIFSTEAMPARFHMLSPLVQSMILSAMGTPTNEPKFWQALKAISSRVVGSPLPAFTMLVEELMYQLGLHRGLGNLAPLDGFRSFFLPFAYVDYFTGFTESRSDFEAIFFSVAAASGKDARWPRLIEAYWTGGERAVLVRQYKTQPPQLRDLKDIERIFMNN